MAHELTEVDGGAKWLVSDRPGIQHTKQTKNRVCGTAPEVPSAELRPFTKCLVSRIPVFDVAM